MLAVYDGCGTHYALHRDNRLEDGCLGEQIKAVQERPLCMNSRHLTMVLYLNSSEWDPADGGTLRCHLAAPRWSRQQEQGASATAGACPTECLGITGTCHLDILPAGGCLALFFSKEILHEVLPAWRRRWAMTMWVEDARIPSVDSKQYDLKFNRAADLAFVKRLLAQREGQVCS